MFYFSFSCVDLLHGNCLLTRFNFSMKILLAKIIFLFWILLCNLLNMSSFCIDSISWCCFVVPLFRCCSIPIVSPVFRCPVSVPVFRQSSGILPVFCPCSVFRNSMFRCSWFYQEHWNKKHRRNSRTPRNIDRTAEHPGTPAEHSKIPTEHQHNTSGPPWNNRIIQNEEQL